MIQLNVTEEEAINRLNAAGKILDVGGGLKPLSYATHVMDIISWEARKSYGYIGTAEEHYNKATWLIHDACETPWPYNDKEFDVVWCSQLVEDVRDPVAVVKEISRVGKQGYITSITREYESSKQGEEIYTGYIHHRWLLEIDNNAISFLYKYPILPLYKVDRPITQFLTLWWQDSINAYEKYMHTQQQIIDEFKNFADKVNSQ